MSELMCTVHSRYDDEHGDYRMVLGDHVGFRFEILGRLGKGSFGQVHLTPLLLITDVDVHCCIEP